MKKILVIGSGGAGKSTLARRLGEMLGIPAIHLDQEYWQAGWVEPAKEDWAETVRALIEREAWIMDGNYGGTLAPRLAVCDAVVFLDMPVWLCLWRVTRRWWQYRHTTRPDMAAGCQETLSLEFLLWILNFRRSTRPQILQKLEECDGRVRVFRLKSVAEVKRFLAEAPRLITKERLDV